MEQLKCLSCGHLNLPVDTVCRECGTALTTANSVAVVEPAVVTTPAEPAVVAAPPETVVVRREGMSQSAMLATFLLGLVGLVVVGVLMYQWGKTEAEEDEIARERSERAARNDRSLSESRPAATTTPPVTTTPVVIPSPSAPPTYAPPAMPNGVTDLRTSEPRPDPCAKYVATTDPLLEDWNDLLRTAETQTGDDLAQTLGRMQDLQSQASRVEAPACAGAVHGRLLTAMTAMIDALRTGSPGGGFPSTSEAYRQAQELFEKFQADYDALRVTRS
jgi:hypothetical protein